MKNRFFVVLFLLIFSNAFSMERMDVLKKWAHPDNKPNIEPDISSPYYQKVTDIIFKEQDKTVQLLALDKAVCFFHNIDGDELDKDITCPSIVSALPKTLESSMLKQKAQNLFQAALTQVYRKAQEEALSKKDKDDSKTVFKPDSSSKK